MAANLFGDRFFSFRKPAWHGMGKVQDTEIGAYDAFSAIGTYEVHLEDLVTEYGIKLEQRAVVRSATEDDPSPRIYGVVSRDYQLITPTTVCDSWDKAVNRPVETIGALGKGETFFVTTKLPTLSVRGEEVENYLLLISPMTGSDALQIRVSPVRVVCQNTLVLAKRSSTETYKIVHDTYAQPRLEAWLDGIYERSLAKAEKINAEFAALAAKRLTPKAVDRIIEQVYTMPAMPKQELLKVVADRQAKDYEYLKDQAENRRQAARALFDGKGMGMDSEAAAGTAWGLYNAVVELEDYSTPRPKSDAQRGNDALVGNRAQTKARAYELCLVAATK